MLVSDLMLFEKWKHLKADKNEPFKWRSGIKHDCAKVMELKKEDNYFANGFNERVELEDDYLFPMLKSSDLANGEIKTINRYMLVTQHFIGEQTNIIRNTSPKTWGYLQKYAELFDKRTSIIYRNNPPFSVFGVDDYSFAEWKIAISGFYKKIRFRLIGPYENKPVVFDDTCYFLSAKSREQAQIFYELLSSQEAFEFLSSYIWWDTKRPITLEILNLLSIIKLGQFLGKSEMIENNQSAQLVMF